MLVAAPIWSGTASFYCTAIDAITFEALVALARALGVTHFRTQCVLTAVSIKVLARISFQYTH
jgi:hypothetical protein